MIKSIIFLEKSFLGNFYRHLAIFFWSHWPFATASNAASVNGHSWSIAVTSFYDILGRLQDIGKGLELQWVESRTDLMLWGPKERLEMAHPIQFKALPTFDNFKNLNLRFQIAIYDWSLPEWILSVGNRLERHSQELHCHGLGRQRQRLHRPRQWRELGERPPQISPSRSFKLNCYTYKSSVTRWIDYFSIFGPFTAKKFCQSWSKITIS